MKHQQQTDDDASRSLPLDESSRGTAVIDLTTAPANNESLFVATASVGAIDESSKAPTSSCGDDSSPQESPSEDESLPLGGSLPTRDDSSRDPVMIKLTNAAGNNDSLFAAAMLDGTVNDSSTVPSSTLSHYQCDSHGNNELWPRNSKKMKNEKNSPMTRTQESKEIIRSGIQTQSVRPHSSASKQDLLSLPIPRKIRLQKNKYHNTKFSTPLYNVYPTNVVNPIFTNMKITSKKDVVDDLPPECDIQKGILFVNTNIFIFTPVTETDVSNILSAYIRNLKEPGSRANQRKTFNFMFSWMSMLSTGLNEDITRSKIINLFHDQLNIKSTSFVDIDSYDEFLNIVQVLTFMMRHDMPLIRTKAPKKKTFWLQDLSETELNFIMETMPHTEYEFTDKSFLDLILVENKPESSTEKSLADDVLDVIPMISIKYTCPEIFDKLQNVCPLLVKKYIRNAATHVLILELDDKCKKIVKFFMNQKATAAETLHTHKKKPTTSGGSYTQNLISFIKSTIYYNPVWDFGFQLQTIKYSNKGKHAKSLVNLIPNLFICPCSRLYGQFHQYHNIQVVYQCKMEFFTNSKQFVNHLKCFCDVCPYHAVVLDIISFLYPAELSNAVSNNLKLRQKTSNTKPHSRDFKINR